MRPKSPLLATLVLLLLARPLFADLLLSEIQSANATTLVDSDGEYSDWIEIYNSGTTAVSLSGYHLTDDPADLMKWTFPEVTVSPGGFLLVFASGKDRDPASGELHANFKLSASGDYLALVQADGATIADEYAPQFSAMQDDESFGVPFTGTTFIHEGANAEVLVPNNGGLGLNWTGRSFSTDASWQDVKTGVGFGAVSGPSLDGLVAYYDFEEGTGTAVLDKSGNGHHGTMVNMSGTSDWVSSRAGLGSALDFDGSNDHVNLMTASALGFHGNFTASAWVRVDNTTGDHTILGQDAAGLHLTTRGDLSHFGFWGNDTAGGSQVISAGQWTHLAWRFNNGEQALFVNGVFDASSGGHAALTDNTTVALGRSNGDQGWFDGRLDEVAIFDKALSNAEIAGLASGGALAVSGGLEDAMLGKNASAYIRVPFAVTSIENIDSLSLRLQYNDGFVAYLNGTEVARGNAPTSAMWNSAATSARSAQATEAVETFNLTAYTNLLAVGTNVLAIQGLNVSASDDSFLINPILSAGSLGTGTSGILTNATPGGPNTSVSSLGTVVKPAFNVERGAYTSSFPLTLSTSTSGAQIRYTTNGTEPTSTSGTLYTNPITINKTTVVRAIAYRTGYTSSAIETKTYLFLSDVITQGSSPPSGWPTGSVNGQELDFGMDSPAAIGSTTGALRDALASLDAISLVTDPDNLFAASDGIYVHAGSRGRAWERPSSVELLDKSGGQGFQIDAGLRIRGGFSRSNSNPKHAFRLFFREEYGGDLKYPMFGDEGVDRFKNLDLRTAQNYSWSFQGGTQNTFMREVFARDSQRAMGQAHTRSQFYHLYINGVYWGLYMTQERAEAAFGASYFGGDADDYDVVKSAGSAGGYTIEATDGEITGWATFWARANAMAASTNATTRFNIYQELQGLNPDGSRNAAFPVYLDVDNLVDYMMIILFVGSYDAPVSNFLGNERPNNWFSVWNRSGEFGFQYFAHDCEHSLGTGSGESIVNRNGPWPAGQTQQYSNPQWIHQQLMSVDAYRLRFADRAHELLFNDGILSSNQTIARVNARAATIDQAIIAESARWGDAKRGNPLTRNDWVNAVNGLRSYLSSRPSVLLTQYKSTQRYNGGNANSGLVNAPLYPTLAAPSFNQHGGNVTADFALRFTAANGTVYYTTDGSDPRLANGALAPSAQMADEGAISSQTLYSASDGVRFLVPSNGNLGNSWRNVSFNDASWTAGSGGVGYDNNPTYAALINVDVDSVMDGVNTSIYLRSKFTVADPSDFQGLTLRMKFEDGFVAFLNGQEVASFNSPGELTWNSEATGLHDDGEAQTFVDFDLTPYLGRLVAGTNVIAIHGLNDNLASSDFLVVPELVGNRVSGGSSVILPSSYTPVKARALQNGEWSALAAATFVVAAEPASAANLVFSEIMYHPADPSPSEVSAGFTDADDFEFIELMNISGRPINLIGLQIVEGIAFGFDEGAGSVIDPGRRVLLVRDREAFAMRYGTSASVVGEYTGSLSNGGELIRVVNDSNVVIREFSYDDSDPWPAAADGFGASLILIDPNNNPEPAAVGSWRASSVGGSPGLGDGEGVPVILVNEVLAHTDWPQVDAIELFNPGSLLVDVGGWYLTDDANTPTKYRIPNGTSIPAQGYLVVLEDNDGDPANNASLPAEFFGRAFSLSSAGDELYLYSADSAGLTGYRDGFTFKGSANGVSFGRITTSNAEARYPAMATVTLGSANGEPLPSGVVISEIMYNPSSLAAEYVEIWNSSTAEVLLYDPDNPANTWRLNGMDLDFPPGQTLAPGEVALVVEGDPSAFRSVYGVTPGVKIFGPAGGALDNGGERLELLRPDGLTVKNGETTVPMVVVDAVSFDDEDPWPTLADGQGSSLERLSGETFGDDVASWMLSSQNGGSPGSIPGRVVFLVSVSTQGQGTVVKSPDKLEYAAGEMISLTPQAAPGWAFVRWAGGASGSSSPLTLTVDESVSVQAVFEQDRPSYFLTTSTSGQGTVSLSPNLPSYDEGTLVTVSATPAPGFRFLRWEGALAGSAPSGMVTMSANQLLTAVFVQQVSLTVSVSGEGNVTIVPDKVAYDVGEQVTVTAAPSGNAVFDGWTGDASGNDVPLMLTMDVSKNVTANFASQFALTVVAQPGGMASASPSAPFYRSGSQVALTAVALPGYRFAGWSGDASGNANPFNVTVSSNQMITAQFAALASLTLATEGNGEVTHVPNKSVFDHGEEVSLTATPAEGWEFVQWLGGLSGSVTPAKLQVNGSVSVTAVFKQRFALDTETTGEGTVLVSPQAATYRDGVTVSLVASAAPDWRFVRWDGAGGGSTDNPLTLTMDASKLVTAVFEETEPETAFEVWQKSHFTEAERLDLSLSGPMGDPDGDGLVNLLEHVFATAPRDRRSLAGPVVVTVDGNERTRFAVSVPIVRSEGVRYQLEVSHDLVNWFYNGDGTGQSYVTTPSVEGDLVTWAILPVTGQAEQHRYCRFVAELED